MTLVNGIHQLDLANWFADDSFAPRVAVMENVHFDAVTEDYFYASLATESSCSAAVQSSWSPVPPQSLDGMMTTPSGRMRIEAEADGGSTVLTAAGYRVNKEDVALDGVQGVDPFVAELGHFVDAIRNGVPLWATPEDNWRVQKLVEDCRQSAARTPRRLAPAA